MAPEPNIAITTVQIARLRMCASIRRLVGISWPGITDTCSGAKDRASWVSLLVGSLVRFHHFFVVRGKKVTIVLFCFPPAGRPSGGDSREVPSAGDWGEYSFVALPRDSALFDQASLSRRSKAEGGGVLRLASLD